MEDWVRVLQNVVQRNALKLLLSQEDQKPTAQGWLIKVKHGHQKKCWCVLIGKMFIYFRTPNEQVGHEHFKSRPFLPRSYKVVKTQTEPHDLS